MSYEEETEFITSTYRCIDPIQNFKIRVVLKPVKSKLIPSPYFACEKPGTSCIDSPTQKVENAKLDTEEHVFSWQEKIFSKSEISKYSDLSNCKTKLQEKYHEEVTKLARNSDNASMKLFTYVDVDNYKVGDDILNPLCGKSGCMSVLGKRMDNEVTHVSGTYSRSFRHVSNYKVVNYHPNDDFKMRNHLINTCTQKMFIMADLTAHTSDSEKKLQESGSEHILCMLTYYPFHKVLKMSPSFSKNFDEKPYLVGINGQYSGCTYHYWLHHASSSISLEESNNERQIFNKILQRQRELRRLQIGNNFLNESGNSSSLIILGEIESAHNFLADHLSVHYTLVVPPGWESPSRDGALASSTHTSSTDDSYRAHFSHLFHVHLIFQEFPPSVPELVFEVVSTDRWKIYRNEGYATVNLPRKAGEHSYTLPCWRASDDSVKAKLNRFFLGGSEVLQDVSYAIAGVKNDVKRVATRFGMKTESSGCLKVRLYVVYVSDPFKEHKEYRGIRDADATPFATFDTSDLMGSVNSVLEAFRRARERMLKAKQSLDVVEQ